MIVAVERTITHTAHGYNTTKRVTKFTLNDIPIEKLGEMTIEVILLSF